MSSFLLKEKRLQFNKIAIIDPYAEPLQNGKRYMGLISMFCLHLLWVFIYFVLSAVDAGVVCGWCFSGTRASPVVQNISDARPAAERMAQSLKYG